MYFVNPVEFAFTPFCSNRTGSNEALFEGSLYDIDLPKLFKHINKMLLDHIENVECYVVAMVV